MAKQKTKAKEKSKKSSGSGSGISTKMIFGIAAAGLALMAFSSSTTNENNGGGGGGTDPCTAYYNVNGNRICETALPDLNYIYWKGAASGDGWYKISDFPSQYGIAQGSWETSIRNAAGYSLDPANPNYSNSMNILRNAYRGTTGPLQRA